MPTISSLNGQVSLGKLIINQRTYYNLPYSAFWGWLSMESQPHFGESGWKFSGFWGWLSIDSQPQNPENFHPCIDSINTKHLSGNKIILGIADLSLKTWLLNNATYQYLVSLVYFFFFSELIYFLKGRDIWSLGFYETKQKSLYTGKLSAGPMQILYNTPCLNKDLDITLSCCGPPIFLTIMEIYKRIIGKSSWNGQFPRIPSIEWCIYNTIHL